MKRDLSLLFDLVFKNKYIRSIIFQQLHIFNLYYGCREFKSVQEILDYKYKDYLFQIKLNFNVTCDINLVSVLPINVRSLIFYSRKFHSSVPSWIEYLEIRDCFNELPKVNIIDQQEKIEFQNLQLKKLDLHFTSVFNEKLEIKSNLLPSTVNELNIKNYPLKIKKNTLPLHLKKLSLDPSCGGIEDNSLFNLKELEELYVDCCSPDILNLLVISNGQLLSSLPNSLKILDLNPLGLNSEYDLPNNFQFPNSLEKLKIYVKRFNFKLPSQLHSLTIEIKENKSVKLNSNTFPNTLKELKANLDYIVDSNGISILPNSLETLVLSNFNQKLTSYCLPPNLKYFKISSGSFNNTDSPLTEKDIFPSSLTLLDLKDCKSFNVPFGINTLPSNLKTLLLNKNYLQILVDGSVPYSLELIDTLDPLDNENSQFSIIPYKLKNPYTIVKNWKYYEIINNSPQDILVYIIHPAYSYFPYDLSLLEYTNLEYLDLNLFNHTLIPGENIPTNNSIKTLILSNNYKYDINLEDFKKLESLYIKNSKIKIITNNNQNQINNNHNHNQNNHNNHESHNFYSLKEIIVNYNNISFLDNIDPILYPFIKLIK